MIDQSEVMQPVDIHLTTCACQSTHHESHRVLAYPCCDLLGRSGTWAWLVYRITGTSPTSSPFIPTFFAHPRSFLIFFHQSFVRYLVASGSFRHSFFIYAISSFLNNTPYHRHRHYEGLRRLSRNGPHSGRLHRPRCPLQH